MPNLWCIGVGYLCTEYRYTASQKWGQKQFQYGKWLTVHQFTDIHAGALEKLQWIYITTWQPMPWVCISLILQFSCTRIRKWTLRVSDERRPLQWQFHRAIGWHHQITQYFWRLCRYAYEAAGRKVLPGITANNSFPRNMQQLKPGISGLLGEG